MDRKKIDIYKRIKESFVIPIFSSNDFDEAKMVVESVIEGGAKIIELTHRKENSYNVFKKIQENFSEKIIIGAGSIIDVSTASLYLNSGAKFIVGPNYNSEIMKLCNRINVLYIPGCATLNEILKAYEEGAIVVKLFPAEEIGGVNFLKNIKGPCPWVECIPTGGIKLEKECLAKWKEAGAVAVGMGSKLLKKELIKNRDKEGLKNNISKAIEIIKQLNI